MKLEKQVCSLELAKKLKGLGVKQDSLLEWQYDHLLDEKGLPAKWQIKKTSQNFKDIKGIETYSAFTVAELGEMLPDIIDPCQYLTCVVQTTMASGRNGWKISYLVKEGQKEIPVIWADTEADARAKMLIYLLENKLVTLYYKK